jgi:2-oxo-4-hydroxy-4-carboxy--5-ureidoimidazoline (OHCU) decarboxylase
VNELPRRLSIDELAELFEGRMRLVERLADMDDPLECGRALAHEIPYAEKVEALAAHPAISQVGGLSPASAAEHGADDDPAVLEALADLEARYEQRHGFCFVVFINRRSKAEILEILRARIENPTETELATGLDELVAIAQDRWRSG